MEDAPQPNSELLIEAVQMRMPFGKYKDTLLTNLPIAYLEWFARKSFPRGKLGVLLQTVYEVKLNGLDYLLDDIKLGIQAPPSLPNGEE